MQENLLIDLHVTSETRAVGGRDGNHHEKRLPQIKLHDSFLKAFFKRFEAFSTEMTLNTREELLEGGLADKGDTLKFQHCFHLVHEPLVDSDVTLLTQILRSKLIACLIW